ncbi:SAM-dependent methyltransferase [Methylophaga sp. 42_25_T18]|nr:SAM-dependent methyltransferase [Methylophaga sp. 42_25_T18]
MKLENIVPWGRSFAEYQAMFKLTNTDLQQNILGCGDGPAAFNKELTQRGGQIISIDPIYEFSASQIKNRINAVYDEVLSQVENNKTNFVWKNIKSVDELGQIRMQAMNDFLTDYDDGKQQGRYLSGSLPKLDFSDHQFDLALCSHFLFLYSDHFTLEQHIKSVLELCRVAKEVRIYPLVSLDGKGSPHLDLVIDKLNEYNIETQLQPVDYQFQQGATKMLVASTN